MTDPRWAALAAEIAHDLNPEPPKPKKPRKPRARKEVVDGAMSAADLLARVNAFVEPRTDFQRLTQRLALGSVEPDITGKFRPYDIVLLTNSNAMSAEVGAIARVLGYRHVDPSRRASKAKYLVVQWSDDDYSHGQLHGGYLEENFSYLDHIDPF